MEYIYAAMLLHKAGKDVNESNVKSVLTAAGASADDGRVKALVAALDGVNIEEVIKEAAVVSAAPAAAAAGGEAKAEAKEKEEDKGPAPEQAAAGLSGLFG